MNLGNQFKIQTRSVLRNSEKKIEIVKKNPEFLEMKSSISQIKNTVDIIIEQTRLSIRRNFRDRR
jgi:hypothetical protein